MTAYKNRNMCIANVEVAADVYFFEIEWLLDIVCINYTKTL